MVASGTWTDPLSGANYPFAGRLTSSDMNAWVAAIRAIDTNVVTSAIRTWTNIIDMNGTDYYLDVVFDDTHGDLIFAGSDSGSANVVVDYTADWATITGGTIATTEIGRALDHDGSGNVVMGISRVPVATTDLAYLSTDGGETWAAQSLPSSSKYLEFVRHNGTVFVAGYCDFATAAYIATSTDGATWTARSNPLAYTGWGKQRYGGIATDGAGKVVMLPPSTGTPNQVAYSADGITWSAATLTAANWISVVYTPTYGWIAYSSNGATIYESSTGATWGAAASATTPSAASSVLAMTSIGDIIIMVYYDGTDAFLVYSSDGCATWSVPALRIDGANLVGLRSTGGRIIVLDYSSNEKVYISARTPIGD